jgi:hypothetical protein
LRASFWITLSVEKNLPVFFGCPALDSPRAVNVALPSRPNLAQPDLADYHRCHHNAFLVKTVLTS